MRKPLSPYAHCLTDDAIEVLRFARESRIAGFSTALVTLVEVRGGAARAIGAQMAVREDGSYCGFVSGGCTEAAVAAEALEAIQCGDDRDISFGRGSNYFDIVLPCGGGITLNVHILRTVRPLVSVLSALDNRKRAGLRYFASLHRLEHVRHPLITGWEDGHFDIAYRPRARVMIFGRSIEMAATAKLARAVGYEVFANDVYDAQAARQSIDPDTAVVLLFHDLDLEIAALRAALAANPFYIGALGSKRTHERRVQQLTDMGYRESDIVRIRAPIGLFPKARDAPSRALSVLADIAALRSVDMAAASSIPRESC